VKINIPHFQKQSIFPPGYQGCIFGVVFMLLAVCLMAGTVNYQRPSGLLCGRRLSAGFPLAFVCDASGESPLSSVGKIDWADANSIHLPGSLVDIVFYNGLLPSNCEGYGSPCSLCAGSSP
jgi:hypothetical protein